MTKGRSQFETFAKRTPQISVLTDQPLSAEQIRELFESDPFNFRYKLGPVYDILRHKKPNTKTEQMPTAVLITGDWGTGKTTAMKWLECLLIQWNKTKPEDVPKQEYVKVRPVWFYPWKYHTRQDVWRGLVAEVIANSIDIKNLTLKRLQYAGICFIRLLLKIAGIVVDSAKVKLQSPDSLLSIEIGPGKLKKIMTEYSRAAHPEEAYRNKFEKALSLWITNTMGKNERMVIFIDDLDRCMPEVALQVLEALKLYLNIPNLVFVLGVDKEIIEKLVVEHYKKLGLIKEKDNDKEETRLEEMSRQKVERKARQYLSKMFQVEIELAPSQKQISDFFEQQLRDLTALDKHLGKKDDSKQNHRALFERLILKFARRNPRELNKQLNNALMAGAGTEMIDSEDDEDKPTFEQGLQLYFICEILREGYTLILDMINTDSGRRFFKDWSNLAIEYKDISEYSKYTLGSSDENQTEKSGLLTDRLREMDDTYSQEDYLQLLNDPDLRALMEIQFSRKLAEFTILTPLVITPEPADVVAVAEGVNVVITDKRHASKDYIIVRDAVARQLNKNPEDVGPDDYRDIIKLNLSATGIIDLTPLRKFPDLKELNLFYTKVIDVSPLASLTKLQLLNLRSTQVKNIDPLASLINLKELNLSVTNISDVSPLAFLTNLQELHLTNTKVIDAGPLSSLTNLQRLHLDSSTVSDISPLASLTNLQSLILSITPLTDVSPLSTLSNLQTLWIPETNVSDIYPLSSLTNLQQLNLGLTQVDDIGPLASLTNLKELWLSNTKVNNLGPLAPLAKLQILFLGGTHVTDVSPLASLVNIQWLNLWGTQVDDVGPLASLTNLKTLSLGGTQVTDLGPLASLANLRELDVSSTQVVDISPLKKLNSLEILKIQKTPIQNLEPLKGLNNLKELLLLDCDKITVGHIVDLQKALPDCKILSALREDVLLDTIFRLFFNPKFAGLTKTKFMRFGKGGVILDGKNNNESSWRIQSGYLELLDSEGQVHSRFYYNPVNKRFSHTNDPDTGSIRKHSIRDQYMLPMLPA